MTKAFTTLARAVGVRFVALLMVSTCGSGLTWKFQRCFDPMQKAMYPSNNARSLKRILAQLVMDLAWTPEFCVVLQWRIDCFIF